MAPVKLPVVNGEYLQAISGSREDIKTIIAKESCIPLFIRLAFHDALSYDEATHTGGANGTIRTEKELSYPGNEGLGEALKLLEPVAKKHPSLSYADLFQLAAQVSVEVAGGPHIAFVPGRRDSTVMAPQSRMPTLLDPASQQPSAAMFKKLAKRTGMTHRHLIVACGVQQLGRWWGRDQEQPPYYAKSYGQAPLKFDNSYYRDLLEGKGPAPDRCLLQDPELKLYIEEYASHPASFLEDFTAVHEEVSLLGTRLQSSSGGRNTGKPNRPAGQSVDDIYTTTQLVIGAVVVIAGVAVAASWWMGRRRRRPLRLGRS
ncbi:hypothetical protein WJX72_006037 [[Myrmecia] bisecta]|uniref:Plant heme peroxidase family profile domain-containing protein n=1 Tax=[Myrmecia] bisecta TaxID=41462 RepID=A0AAW1PSW8_9CHLO